MKKLVRVALALVAVALVLAVVGLVVGLKGLDYQPYLEAPYYARTMERLANLTNQAAVVRGPLAAGFGRARLTPTLNAEQDDPVHGRFRSLPLAGFGNRHGKPATGVHDDLWIKAIAVRVGERTAVWIGADALIVPWEVSDAAVRQLAEDPGLRREQIYFGATHTHGSLGGWGEGVVAEAFAGPFQPGVRVWMATQMVSAARTAVADLRPASFGEAKVKAPEFVRNRLVGKRGRVDDELGFAVFRQSGGLTAVLGTYGAHATVLGGGNFEFSADYPGAWQREVERATGGLALFLAGGVGSHSPNPGGGGFEGTEHMGRALARVVIDQLPKLNLTNETVLGLLGCEVDLPELHTRLTDGWRLRPALAQRLLPVRSRTYLQALRLGATTWISTPCDFSGELALDFKDFVRVRGGDALVTSFNGDYLGYLIPARYYHMSGYEPRTMSFFGPDLPDYFSELIRTMTLAMYR